MLQKTKENSKESYLTSETHAIPNPLQRVASHIMPPFDEIDLLHVMGSYYHENGGFRPDLFLSDVYGILEEYVSEENEEDLWHYFKELLELFPLIEQEVGNA